MKNLNHNKLTKRIARVVGLLIVMLCLPLSAGFPGTDFTPGPQPGDVYWEHVHVPKNPKTGRDWYICRGYSWTEAFTIKFPDLTHAKKADISIEYWGGHVGTSEQRLVVNGNEDKPVYYPLPKNTPTRPECYLRNMMGNSSSVLPLDLLKEGDNHFEFFHGPQICHGWNWPQTWAYAAILRVYFDPDKVPHPSGEITKPATGDVIDDNPQFEATAQSKDGIKSVDFIGYYEDFDWEGNGLYRQWHYQTQKGVMKYHVGSIVASPYEVTWETKNLPDQPLPMKFMARIRDKKGMYYMTEAVTRIRLKRTTKSVKLGKPFDVPEKFCSRRGRLVKCNIRVPKNLDKATGARLIVPSWSARHKEEPGTIIKVNKYLIKQKFGNHHYYKYDEFPVTAGILKRSKNDTASFSVFSATDHHAAEIMWPGPALLIGFPDPDTTYCDTCTNEPPPPDPDDSTGVDRQGRVRSNYVPYLSVVGKPGRVDGLVMEYQLPRTARMELSLVNLEGKRIRTLFRGMQTAGTHRETMSVGKLPAGMYFARLLIHDGGCQNVRTRKIVVF